jgi:methylmalonyl-CoA/ethylmalonyl-CoA epimerase
LIIGLDHVAIAVDDLDAAIRRLVEDLGLTLAGTEDVVSAQTRTAFFPLPGARIELIHPLDGKGPVAASLEKRGPGLHHLCLRTDDLDGDVARLAARGYRFTSDGPTRGAHDSRVIFLHPKSTGGVLIELVEGGDDHGHG